MLPVPGASVPILPWRQSTSSPWADSPISDTPALRDLLQILTRLIGMHEVKLAKNLIQELSSGPLASASLEVSKEELCSMLYRFGMQKRQDGDAGLIELAWFCGVKTMVSEAGSGAGDRAAGAPTLKSSTDRRRPASSPGKGGLAATVNCPLDVEVGHPSQSFLRHVGRAGENEQLGGARRAMSSEHTFLEADMTNSFNGCVSIAEDRPPSRSKWAQDRPPSRLFLEDASDLWEAHPTATSSCPASANPHLTEADYAAQERPTTRIQHSCATASGIPPSSVVFTPVEEIAIDTEVDHEGIAAPSLSVDKGVAPPNKAPVEQKKSLTFMSEPETIEPHDGGRGSVTGPSSHLSQRFDPTSSMNTGSTDSLWSRSIVDFKQWFQAVNTQATNPQEHEGEAGYEEKLKHIWEHDVQDVSLPDYNFIIHPNGHLRMTWDAFALIAIMLEAITIPINTCWEVEANEVLIWLMTLFFSVDMIFNFMTGFYQDGIMVMKLRKICRHYVTGWFVIDLVSTFPWGIIFASGTNAIFLKFTKVGKLMRMLRLLRIAKLNVLLKRIEELFCSSAIIIAISLLKMVFGFLLVCHWCACFWGWLGHASRHRNKYQEAHCTCSCLSSPLCPSWPSVYHM